MPDNSLQGGTDTIRDIDRGTAKTQVVQLDIGGAAGELLVTNAMPVTGTFYQATQPVSGAFYQVTQPVSIAAMPSTPVTGQFWQTTQPVSLASTTVTGSVAVTGAFYQATQPVSGTFWQATQPVSGTVAVTGTFWQATQPVSLASTTITGTVSTNDPDTSASGTITTTDAVVAAPAGAGAFTTGASTAGSLVSVACPGGDSAWNVQITGLTSGFLYFEASLDSTNGTDGQWINVNGRRTGVVNTQLAGVATANGMYRGNTSGAVRLRVRSVGALTGTPAITIRISAGIGAIFLNASIPAGTNNIGLVTRSTDTGRVMWSAASAIAGVTAVTTEALVTMVPQRDGTAVATATSHTVTSGKRLRIQSITVGLISTAAAVISGRISLRIGAAGAATAASPIIHTLAIPSGAALAQAGGSMTLELPDGIEFSGAQQFGVSQVCSVVTGTLWVSLAGFEYTP